MTAFNYDFIKSRKREKMYEKLSKNALLNMYFGTITGTIAVLAIIFVLELLFVIPNNIGILVILGLIIAIILVFNAIISPVFRFHRYRYKIDEESIDIIEGYVFTERNIVPIERLHKLQISQGPFDKLCNVARVKVTTAGGDVEIRFLENEKAEKISQVLFSGKVNELTSNEIEIAFKGFPVYNVNERLNIVDILVKYEICSSKREAREFITTGSISINGNKITELDYIIDNNTTIDSKYVVIRKGKKKYFILKY